jgi:RND family efflux transporter MFP subunit
LDTKATHGLVPGVSRRGLVLIGLAVVVGTGIGIWRLETGSATAASSEATVKAIRGNVIVTVGGVGRIVTPDSTPVALPTVAGASSGTGAGGFAPAGAVFARISGHLARYLATQGQHVRAGQPIALLGDGGAAAKGVDLARVELAAAEYELDQKRHSDPVRGYPPTAAEVIASQLAVRAAHQRLARLLAPPRKADVSAARLELKRAQADLATLRGAPAARSRAIQVATKNLGVAEKRLARLLGPADPADVSAAKSDLAKAEADLISLQRPNVTPAPEALVAALKLVNDARMSLALAQQAKDAQAIEDAQASLDDALTELATLLKPGPGALPQQLDAAQKAVDAAGQRLARLMGPPNAADVAAAELERDRAQSELETLRAGPGPASIAAATEAVATARAKLAQLLGPPLRSDVTAARLDVRKAEADLAVLRTRGAPASATDITLAELKVKAARDRLDIARAGAASLFVRAPSPGTITALLAMPGAPVDLSTPVATINDLDHLGVSVDLSEFDAARVKPGLKAVVRVDALGGRAVPGTVRVAALTGIDNGGVVTFPVKVSLTRSAGLKPGMNASVRIIVAERRKVVLIPLEAISREDEDRAHVTVVNASGAESLRPVELGLANNKNVEIRKGLRVGDRVLLPEAAGPEEEA